MVQNRMKGEALPIRMSFERAGVEVKTVPNSEIGEVGKSDDVSRPDFEAARVGLDVRA
jgi:hypothetical protein